MKVKWTLTVVGLFVAVQVLCCVSVESKELKNFEERRTSKDLVKIGGSRWERQAEASYEDGGEYEYEEEGEETDNTTSTPAPQRNVNNENPNKPDKEDGEEERHEDTKDTDYDGEYEYEDENGNHEEEERDREEEERIRLDAQKEEERRQEEERVEAEKRRKEELARRESEARQEEEDRAEDERREKERLLAEQRHYEERRREEERRQAEMRREEEEDDDHDHEEETTPEPDAEEPSVDDLTTAQPMTDSETEEPDHEEQEERGNDLERQHGDPERETETEAPTEQVDVPIQESGRHDLERYRENTNPEPEVNPEESSYEYVESEENPEGHGNDDMATSTTSTTTTSTTTPEPVVEKEVHEDEEYESSVEAVDEHLATTEQPPPPPSVPLDPPSSTAAPPLRPLQPFQTSSVAPSSEEVEPSRNSDEVDRDRNPDSNTVPDEVDPEEDQHRVDPGHIDPNEYEVEPPASAENEIPEAPEPPPRQPEVNKPPMTPAPELTPPETGDSRVLGEREKYHHQDLDLDEDEEEEAELYEGRRFSAERRNNEDPRHGSDRRVQPAPLAPTTDEQPVTDLSQEPTEEEDTDADHDGRRPDDDRNSHTTPQLQPTPSQPRPTESPFHSEEVSEEEPDEPIGQPEQVDRNVDPGRSMTPDRPHVSFVPEQPRSPGIECFSGYKLSPDGTECLDVDECGLGVCGPSQICANLPGSYRCACNPGFIKDFRNEKQCRDLNECEIGNGGCSQDCVNTPGSFYCSCADDFDLAPNRRTCLRRPPPPPTTTTTTSTTTTTTTTTPPPPTTTTPPPTPPPPPPTPSFDHGRQYSFPSTPPPPILVGNEESPTKNCPTPPVPRGAGIAYLYCSRSPVGIHHRHSQYERRLIEDWTARKTKAPQGNFQNMVPTGTEMRSPQQGHARQFRNRRNLRRRQRQTTYSPGSMCELRCRSGFELRGHYTLHCNASVGAWQGTTNGFCQALPKPDNLPAVPAHTETTPSNEIPRVAIPYPGMDFLPTKPSASFRQPIDLTTTFRPIFHQPRPITTGTREPMTPPPPASRFSDPVEVERYWTKPRIQSPFVPTTTRRPYYQYTPVTYRPMTTPAPPTTTTSRNSFIQLSYKFKTPWIRCPDDIRIDLQPNQNLAYVIIPQPQTNVDWWRQVSAEPSWAKGLETEIGPGKQRITFRARTSAPFNNTAECAFTLEVRDMDPPRVRECPESLTLRLNPGQSARTVTWLEPHFSDNVRISSMKQSHHPGTILTLGEHLVNYEAKDPSDNVARCFFTITILPPASSSYNGNGFHTTHLRKPLSEGVTAPTTTTSTTSGRPEVHSVMRNVVCYVGKKGRRIVFLSRVIPRGCSEMTMDMIGEPTGPGSYNTLNTISQNSAENMATSQISSVSYTSHDTPQSASAFGQALSNGRNTNRMVHSSSSVTNGAHGTNSKSSSYAIAVSSSSRNFEIPFLTDKQVYEEDDLIPPTNLPQRSSAGAGEVNQPLGSATSTVKRGRGRPMNGGGQRRQRLPGSVDLRAGGHRRPAAGNDQDQDPTTPPVENKKYFRHFNSWGTTNGLLRGD